MKAVNVETMVLHEAGHFQGHIPQAALCQSDQYRCGCSRVSLPGCQAGSASAEDGRLRRMRPKGEERFQDLLRGSASSSSAPALAGPVWPFWPTEGPLVLKPWHRSPRGCAPRAAGSWEHLGLRRLAIKHHTLKWQEAAINP